MNTFEHLVVFSIVVVFCLYFWWTIQSYHVKIGDKKYYAFRTNNNLFEKVYNGSKNWYYNPYKLIIINKTEDKYFTVDGITYSMWKDV